MQLEEFFRNRSHQFWMLQLLGWTGWVTLFAIRDAYWGQPFERVALLVVDALAGFLLTTVMRYAYQAIWNRPILFRILAVLLLSYAMAAIWQPFKNFSSFYYFDEFSKIEQYGLMVYFNGIIGYSYFLMLAWSVLYFGLKFYRMLQDEIQRSVRAESMAHEAQLRMLRYQLNPHFLFNTLNAISTLILSQESNTANAMVSKLSNFLRYSLDKDPMQKVDFEHELNTTRLYLDIEKVRFEDRLTVNIEVDDEARAALVPSLLLQPLVENSIKFAVANREDGGAITIRGKVFAGELLLEVSDDGPGVDLSDGEPESGVGLANTRNRLKELYGKDQSFRLGNAKPHGLKIDIRLPFEKED